MDITTLNSDTEEQPSAAQRQHSEPQLFKRVLSALNDVSVDSFHWPMKFKTIARREDRIELNFTFRVRRPKQSEDAVAALRWPELVTPASLPALIEDLCWK